MSLRYRDGSKSESLLGANRSKAISPHGSNRSFSNCIKILRTIVLWIEFIVFVMIWSLYITKSQNDVVNKHLFDHSNFKITYLRAYYLIQIIVQTTMIILCMVFYIEFVLYTDNDWITAVKQAKEAAILKLEHLSDSTDVDGFPVQKYSKQRAGNYKQKAQSIIDDCNICSRLCSFSFCFRRIGVGIANVFTLTWSELHVLCMLSCIYYLLSAMLRLYHFNPIKEEHQFLFTVSDILTAFGIILPPLAYSLSLRLKMIYDRKGTVSDITLAGSQWETRKNRESYWYQSHASSQMSIVQASKSILNDKTIKLWMFITFSFQLFIFVMDPVFAASKFRYYLQSMYDICDQDSTTSQLQVVFIVHVLIMRIAVPLLLLNTVFSFTPKSSHSAQIMHYCYFHHIITPSSIILITMIAFVTNYFLSSHPVLVTWIGIIGSVLLSIWQIFVFVSVLSLADHAQNDQEQFFGFAQLSKASLFNYFSKGIVYVFLWFVSFGALLVANSISTAQIIKAHGQIPSVIFGTTSMFLLVPLQKIAISPTYRNYFGRKQRTKYLVTFHVICLLSALFIVQKFIFVTTFYYDILTNVDDMKDPSFATSFSLSFASIGFFIWLFGKYCGILYPIGPKSLKESGSITEMSEFIGNKSRRKSDEKRKDSKMSLTALHNIYIHTPSIKLYDSNEEYDDLTADKIGYDKSKKVQKAISISRGKLRKMGENKREDSHSIVSPTYDAAAKAYGLNRSKMSFGN